MPIPHALILAAGRGERMRPLTDHTPKPLLPVRGQPLMQWTLAGLLRGGVTQIVVNTAWLGGQIEDGFGPQRLSALCRELHVPDHVTLHFSREGADFGHALETAGGIARALPLLAREPGDVFWAVAGDVFMPGFDFSHAAAARFAASGRLAHLWLVPNPPHNPAGDFGLSADGMALNDAAQWPAAGPPQGGPAPSGGSAAGAAAERGGQVSTRHTFSACALYRRALFEPPWCDIPPGNPHGTAAPLAPLLRRAIAAGQVSATLYTGAWADVGTPQRLAQIDGDLPGSG
jgi:MurNAc alpha-1-phosphate uridylyltransferase